MRVFEDLCSGSSEKYWHSEGNNKRMRGYHKLSKILKTIRYILIVLLAIYIVVLSTESIVCLFDKMEFNLLSSIDLKKFILDVYITTFISTSFIIFYSNRKQKYLLKKIIYLVVDSLLFLPVSILLIYNFLAVGSFMRCFYLLVVFSVVMIIIEQLTNRIDKLYDIAVGSIEINRKGDKKVCKEK